VNDINLKFIPEEKSVDNSSDNAFEVKNIEEDIKAESGSKVKIKFGRFVELVAKHSFIDVVENNKNQEIVIDANLLADLANAEDDSSPVLQKWTLVAIGIIVGIVLAYIILK